MHRFSHFFKSHDNSEGNHSGNGGEEGQSQETSRGRAKEGDEIVDNPNSFGLWGRYQDAAATIITNDQSYLNARPISKRQSSILTQRNTLIGDRSINVSQQNDGEENPWKRIDVAPEDDPNSPPKKNSPHAHFHLPTRFQNNHQSETNQEHVQDHGDDTPFAKRGVPPALRLEVASNKPPHHLDDLTTFDSVHGLKANYSEQLTNRIAIRLGHLFKRPLIRQWVLDDKLYQEIDDRLPSQFELFFDLVMVGIIHKLADGAAEAATGLNVAKFILCFYPAWSVWTDLRSYINVSGTDDVLQRMYLLLSMILLVGYAANATGIQIEKEVGERFERENFESASTELEGTIKKRGELITTLTNSIGTILVKRWEDGGGFSSDGQNSLKLVRKIGDTNYWFAEGWQEGISGAIGFYLVAKGCRAALYFIYGIFLPKFRKALWLKGISLVVISSIYLPILIIDLPGTIVVLICSGIIAELTIRYIVAALLQIIHGRSKHAGRKTYMPAYSLPHMMERTTLFTILVTGETIMNATFVAKPDEFGPAPIFWRAAMSMTIAFMLMWLYFDVDSSRTYVHGLKRHWFTSITYTHLHFPLCASLILMSSTLTAIIHAEAINIRHVWLFSGSISVSMLCMAILGMLHKSLDLWGSSLIPKSARIGSRLFLAGFFIILPFIHRWTSAEFLAVHAGILVLAVAFETFGKLGAIGRVYDPIRAEELRQERVKIRSLPSSPLTTKFSNNNNSGGGGEGISIDHHTIDLKRAKSFTSSFGGGHSSQFDNEKQSRLSIPHRRISTMIGSGLRKFNQDGRVKGPDKRASWHEFDDLTNEELGENDVGVESELGHLRSKKVSTGERWAYVAT